MSESENTISIIDTIERNNVARVGNRIGSKYVIKLTSNLASGQTLTLKTGTSLLGPLNLELDDIYGQVIFLPESYNNNAS